MRTFPKIFLCATFIVMSLYGCGFPNPVPLVKYSTYGNRINATALFDGDYPSVSPDGRFLAYVDSGIMIADLKDGTTKRLINSGGSPSWAPNGKEIIFSNKGGIWTTTVDGGDTRLLLDTANAESPSWGHDKKRIVYASNGVNVYNTETKEILNISDRGFLPSWSPVCDHIIFSVWDETQSNFMIAGSLLGSDERGIVVKDGSQAKWSSDGRFLLFSRTGIWIRFMDSENYGKEIRLTQEGSHPCWSKNGKWIFFSFRGMIYKMNSPYTLVHDPIVREIHPHLTSD